MWVYLCTQPNCISCPQLEILEVHRHIARIFLIERRIILSVIRVEKTKNYTVMSNYHFKEKKAVEKTAKDENGQVKVVSMRYTSGATIKRNDNYFKFVAEEEWDVSRIEDVQEAREKLWAKLNAEVDSQIEELNNMN